MHENEARFYIKNFIDYPNSQAKTMKGLGTAFVALFVAVAFVGAVTSFVASSVNLGSLLGTLLEFFEILQYLVFLMFLNTDIPPAPADFISTLFQNSIEIGEFIDQIIIQMNIKDYIFSFNYDLTVIFLTCVSLQNFDLKKISESKF